MFGNIDNISSSRSMVSIVARTHVELLAVKTEIFYQIASEYPILKQRMTRHVLLENLVRNCSYFELHVMLKCFRAI